MKHVKLFVLNIVIIKQLGLGPTIFIQMSIVVKTTIRLLVKHIMKLNTECIVLYLKKIKTLRCRHTEQVSIFTFVIDSWEHG